MINVLFIGSTGYLGSNILKNKKIKNYNITCFEGRVQNKIEFEKYKTDFDQVWHFGSTNNKDGEVDYILPGVKNTIEYCNIKNAKLIYASTMGIFTEHKNIYEENKKISTVMINNSLSLNKRNILLIPRVYSKDRDSGLVKAIKENHKLVNTTLQFLTIDQFVDQFFKKINNIGYAKFNNLHSATTTEIKEWILS